jgi:hypothetical protein
MVCEISLLIFPSCRQRLHKNLVYFVSKARELTGLWPASEKIHSCSAREVGSCPLSNWEAECGVKVLKSRSNYQAELNSH